MVRASGTRPPGSRNSTRNPDTFNKEVTCRSAAILSATGTSAALLTSSLSVISAAELIVKNSVARIVPVIVPPYLTDFRSSVWLLSGVPGDKRRRAAIQNR